MINICKIILVLFSSLLLSPISYSNSVLKNTVELDQYVIEYEKSNNLKKRKKTSNLLINLCENGNARACFLLGTKINIIPTEDRINYLNKASLLGDKETNLYLGKAYLEGTNFLKLDHEKASYFFQKSCQQQNLEGCFYYWLLSNDKNIKNKIYEDCLNKSNDICEKYATELINKEKDHNRSLKILENQCFKNNINACTKLSDLYILSENYDKSVELNKLLCKNNYSVACINAAVIIKGSSILKLNSTEQQSEVQKEIQALSEQGCRLDASQCWHLGEIYIMNNININKGLNYIKASCDKGNPHGCNTLAKLYEYGNGVDLDLNKAKQILKNNCEKYPSSCHRLGLLIDQHNGNLNEAKDYYIKACDQGLVLACANVGQLFWKSPVVVPKKQAIYYLDKACMTGDGVACSLINAIYLNDNNVYNVVKYSEKGCELNNGECCHNMGVHNINMNEFHLAKIYAEKSCKLGYQLGCALIGDIYFNNNSPFKDYDKALPYIRVGMENNDLASFSRFYFLAKEKGDSYYKEARDKLKYACEDMKFYAICNILGDSYRNGDLGIVDNEKFIYYSDIACRNNVETSCSSLALFYGSNPYYNHDRKKYYEKLSCDFGNNIHCVNYANSLIQENKTTDGLILLEQLCSKNFIEACSDLGRHLINLPAPLGNTEKGIKILENTITNHPDKEIESAIFILAFHYLSKNNIEKIAPFLKYLEKSEDPFVKVMVNFFNILRSHDVDKNIKAMAVACEQNVKGSCKLLGELYLNKNNFVKQDKKRALKLLEKDCSLYDACPMLAIGYLSGKTLQKNPAKALQRLKAECSVNNDLKCCISAAALIYKNNGSEPTLDKAINYLSSSGINYLDIEKEEGTSIQSFLEKSYTNLMDYVSSIDF